MDPQRFDRLILKLTAALTRRRFEGVLAAIGLTAGLGIVDGSHAKKRKKKKRKKKKCKPKCTGGAMCQKRKCVCPSGKKRCQDECIPNADCCTDDDCEEGQNCQDGACQCPAGEEDCDGVCTATERICEEFCCPVDVECYTEGCACEEFICRCAAERTYCSTPDDTQCCAPGDACDPVAACTTDTCSADNDVCTVGGAFCGDGSCLCTTSAEGESFCADFEAVTGCPAASACADDTECRSGETCANVRCACGGNAFFGICLPPCTATFAARSSNTDGARQRRQLEQTLKLDARWSQPHER